MASYFVTLRLTPAQAAGEPEDTYGTTVVAATIARALAQEWTPSLGGLRIKEITVEEDQP